MLPSYPHHSTDALVRDNLAVGRDFIGDGVMIQDQVLRAATAIDNVPDQIEFSDIVLGR